MSRKEIIDYVLLILETNITNSKFPEIDFNPTIKLYLIIQEYKNPKILKKFLHNLKKNILENKPGLQHQFKPILRNFYECIRNLTNKLLLYNFRFYQIIKYLKLPFVKIIYNYDYYFEGKIAFTIEEKDIIKSITLLPDKRIASVSNDKSVRIWNLTTQVQDLTFKSKNTPITKFICFPDGRFLISSYNDLLLIFDKNFCLEKIIDSVNNTFKRLFILCDNTISITSKNIELFNPDTRESIILQDNPDCFIGIIHLLPNGKLLSGSDNKLKIWNLKTKECEKIFTGHTGYIQQIQFLSSGKIVSASSDKTLRIWNLEGICEAILRGHNKIVYQVKVFNGKIFSISADYTIRVWNFAGICELILKGHQKLILQIQLLPDNRLISSSYDKTMRVWNLETGLCEEIIFTTDYIRRLIIDNQIITRSGNNISVWK